VADTHHYGVEPDQVADLLLPGGEGPHPVAVLVHGGFWRAGYTRTLMAPMAADLAERGWASWNVEYRRAGTELYRDHGTDRTPAALTDVRDAIDALLRLKAPLDRGRVVVIGHSAGGQLALTCAGMPSIALIVSLAGVCDLVGAEAERIGNNAVREFLGGGPDERPVAYADADPLDALPTGARTLLVHGDADQRVPISQSRTYHAAAVRAGDPCELLELPGVDHLAVIDPQTPAWRTIAERVCA
jgi:acetyl esterase/lipase